jgi:hypothetical protein
LTAAAVINNNTTNNNNMLHNNFLAAAVLLLLAWSAAYTTAFQIGSPIGNANGRSCCRPSTQLNLEDHIANMIDNELKRLNSKDIIESKFNDSQRAWNAEVKPTPDNYDFQAEFFDMMSPRDILGFSSVGGVDRTKDTSSPRRRKDEKMAEDDPMRYCADRCVTTGNCDVFEDMFDMDPSEVITFCKECVLSEEEEPCDVPVNLFEDDNDVVGGLHP